MIISRLSPESTRRQREELGLRQIDTMARLASLALPLEPKIERIGEAAVSRIRNQAQLQVQGRDRGRPVYELLPFSEPEKGLAALPAPFCGRYFPRF